DERCALAVSATAPFVPRGPQHADHGARPQPRDRRAAFGAGGPVLGGEHLAHLAAERIAELAWEERHQNTKQTARPPALVLRPPLRSLHDVHRRASARVSGALTSARSRSSSATSTRPPSGVSR